MELHNIKELLATVAQYMTVNITQTFSKSESEQIIVRCVPDPRRLEFIYMPGQEVEYYTCVDEAARRIAEYVYAQKVE